MVFLRKINKSRNHEYGSSFFLPFLARTSLRSASLRPSPREPPHREAFEADRPSDNKIILRHNRQCSARDDSNSNRMEEKEAGRRFPYFRPTGVVRLGALLVPESVSFLHPASFPPPPSALSFPSYTFHNIARPRDAFFRSLSSFYGKFVIEKKNI